MSLQPADKKKLSFSELSMYLDCPFKRYLVYDRKMREQDNPYKLFGRAIDDAIGDFLVKHKPPLEVFTAAANLLTWDNCDELTKSQLTEMASKVSKSKTGPALLDDWREIALIQLTNLFQCYDKDTNSLKLEGVSEPIQILATQVWLKTSGETAVFNGAIDLVGRGVNSGKTYIVDIKTAGRPWLWRESKTRIKEMQLLLYKAHINQTISNDEKYAFLSEALNLDPNNIETWYLFLYRSKTAAIEVKKIASGPQIVSEATHAIEGSARKILTGFKAKTTNRETCKYCHLKERCESGELDNL